MRDNLIPFSRLSPQTEEADTPQHYESSDIAHVMARVRFLNEFIDAVEEVENLRRVYDELFELYKAKLQEIIAPYALDLALSLITLEGSLDPEPEGGEPEAERA
jgi:hypothetical protein